MDTLVANSKNVQKRIQKYLNCSSTIIHPPCDITKFSWQQPGNFFLSMARLDPLKRVSMIVEAFKKMPDLNLVIVSGGTEFGTLKQLADGFDNITILGWVNESRLQTLLATCLATIYIPKDEDFGMSAVESMAAGKPVIGIAEGGLLETVCDGITGTLLEPDSFSVDTLCHAINSFTLKDSNNMKEPCQERAALFDKTLFLQKMNKLIAANNGNT